MTDHVEDTVQEALAERAGSVAMPDRWEQRVLRAGHRRQRQRRRRRAAAAVGAAAAVALIAFGATRGLTANLGLPFDAAGHHARDPEVASVAASDLPLGPRIDLAYATGTGNAPPGDTVVQSSGRWKAGGFVRELEQAGRNLVVDISDPGRLVLLTADGHTRILDRGNLYGVAVSEDGDRVAWGKWLHPSGPTKLTLAELPSGKVLASKTVAKAQNPGVAAFVGDKVLLDYDLAPTEPEDNPFQPNYPYARAWDPGTGEIGPLLGKPSGAKGRIVGLDPARDQVLLMDSQSCLRDLSFHHPHRADRWQTCDDTLDGGSLSANGRRFAGVTKDASGQDDAIWVRDATSGKLLASRVITGIDPAAIVWESPHAILVPYVDFTGHAPGIRYGTRLLRCSADLTDCERVPTATGDGVSALASREGSDLPTEQRFGRTSN